MWIDEPGRVFVAKPGRSELTTTILNDGQVRDLVEKMLKTTGAASTCRRRSHSRVNMRKATTATTKFERAPSTGPGRCCRWRF